MSSITESQSTLSLESYCSERDVSPRCLREKFARSAVISRLKGIEQGKITLVEGTSHQTFGQTTLNCAFHVVLTVHRSRFYPRAAFGADLGAAESFMDGDWTCDNLTDLVRILVINSQ